MCEVKHCRQEPEIIYYRQRICLKCWKKYCEGKIDLKKIFNVEQKELKKNYDKPIQEI